MFVFCAKVKDVTVIDSILMDVLYYICITEVEIDVLISRRRLLPHVFFLLYPQLQGVVGRSGRPVLLHLAAGHDPPHSLQLRHHYLEVKMLTKPCGGETDTRFQRTHAS